MAEVRLEPRVAKACAYTQLIDGTPAVFVDGFIYEGFGAYLFRYVYDAWKSTGSTVKLFISSDGGLLTEGTTFYDLIRAKGVPLESEIYGKAGSTATLFGAASGRDKTLISESSEYFIHRTHFMAQDEYGDYYRVETPPEAQPEIDRTNAMLVNIYVTLTGRTPEEINAQLDKGDQGISMSAQEAVDMGFCAGIIPPVSSKIAAFKKINDKTMSANNKTKVPVKLNFSKLVKAAFGEELTAEVDVEKATADAIAEKDTRIAQLEAENEQLKSQGAKAGEDASASVEAAAKAKEEADKATAEAAAQVTAKDAEIMNLKAQVKDLEAKIPAAAKTIANNADANVGRIPGNADSQSDIAARSFSLGFNGLDAAISAKANSNKTTK